MVVALTEGQWKALRRVTGTERVFAALEETLDADLDREGDRYRLRETIASVLRPWFAARDFATLGEASGRRQGAVEPVPRHGRGCYGGHSGRRDSHEIIQPDVGPMLAAAGPWRWTDDHPPALPAPSLSADTDQVLSDVLDLTTAEIGRLRTRGIV